QLPGNSFNQQLEYAIRLNRIANRISAQIPLKGSMEITSYFYDNLQSLYLLNKGERNSLKVINLNYNNLYQIIINYINDNMGFQSISFNKWMSGLQSAIGSKDPD